MATSTIALNNASVAIGAVDLSDQVQSVTLTIGFAPKPQNPSRVGCL